MANTLHANQSRYGLFLAILTTIALLTPIPIQLSSSLETTPTEANNAVSEATSTPELSRETDWKIPTGLTPHTERVLRDLIRCESGGNENAINPVDRDGTPSLGLLQFKPSTLHSVMVQYLDADIEPQEVMNVIYDGDLQIKAWVAWYGEGKPIEWWQQQFPDCSAKYGYWL